MANVLFKQGLQSSLDQIRANLSKEMQAKNPNMTFKQCFDKLGKETAREFDNQIFQAIKKREKSKINIILVDDEWCNLYLIENIVIIEIVVINLRKYIL